MVICWQISLFLTFILSLKYLQSENHAHYQQYNSINTNHRPYSSSGNAFVTVCLNLVGKSCQVILLSRELQTPKEMLFVLSHSYFILSFHFFMISLTQITNLFYFCFCFNKFLKMQMHLGPGGATTSACLIVGKVHTELMFASGLNSVRNQSSHTVCQEY